MEYRTADRHARYDDRSAADSGISSRSSSGGSDIGVELPPHTRRDPDVRHVDSVQHHLLMSQPAESASPPSAAPYPMVAPHPLHHPLPPHLYGHPEMWKQRYGIPHMHPPDELLDRERAFVHDRERQDRLYREREQDRESAKQKEREREKLQQLERERLEKGRIEKERAAQAVQEHFQESLTRLGLTEQQKRSWISSLPPPATVATSLRIAEEERKRIEQEQQRIIRHESREREKVTPLATFSPYAHNVQIQKSMSNVGKTEYVNASSPMSHNRSGKPLKAETAAGYNVYGYPAFQNALSFLPTQDSAKMKMEQMKMEHMKMEQMKMDQLKMEQLKTSTGTVVMNPIAREPGDHKSSVIVKNDKMHLEPKRHSASPKLREHQHHYLQIPQKYEYNRSSSQSPSQGTHSMSSGSPHAVTMVDMKQQHHRPPSTSSAPSAHHRQSPLPPVHRQSPHQRQSPAPPMPRQSPPESRYGSISSGVAVYAKPSYYGSTSVTMAKPKPAYGKPGITTGTPVCRPPETSLSPVPTKVLIPPSPYQQLTQHQLPPSSHVGPSSFSSSPPPAHSSRANAVLDGPRLLYSSTPPSDAAQAQPLDLGVRSPAEPAKRKCQTDPNETSFKKSCLSPVFDTVAEPSPLIANAATTITAVLNVAAEPPAPAAIPSTRSASLPDSVSPAPCASPPKLGPPSIDLEKSNSPKPPSFIGHKLKKAWLQRHSGEDGADDKPPSKPVGSPPVVSEADVPPASSSSSSSGSAERTASPDNGATITLQCIGSMAVNSINRCRKEKKKETEDLANGHCSADESSSADETKMPPKVKRKKFMAKKVDESPKRKLNSASSTDSDKESASEKESEDNSSGKKTPSATAEKKERARKRGRKPKSPVSSKESTPASATPTDGKKIRADADADAPAPKDPFPKPPVSQLKKTGESFLQDGPCFEVAPKLQKCRECRWTPNQRSRNNANIFCRFYAFRRLRYTKNGQLAIAGFSDPHKDPNQDDLNLWLPSMKPPSPDLDVEMARFVLMQVGDQFCELLKQEEEAVNIHISEDKKIAWKRVVQGVREMCDVCETTLFNFHWACSKCGFVVCIDCYKGRKNGTVKIWGSPGKDRDDLSWLLCTNRQAHEPERLMLTQIIAGEALTKLAKMAHQARAAWDIEMYCKCPLAESEAAAADVAPGKEILRQAKQERLKKAKQEESPLNWLADVALSNQPKPEVEFTSDSSSESSDEASYSALRELLMGPDHKKKKPNATNSQPGSPAAQPAVAANATPAVPKVRRKRTSLDIIDHVISTVMDEKGLHEYLPEQYINGSSKDMGIELKYFVSNYKLRNAIGPGPMAIRIMTLSESKLLYPEVPHAWLCEGKLLRLLDPSHPGNYTIFQDQWKRGQPVIVSDVTKKLNLDLWHPESFSKDFGEVKNDLINCVSGKIVPNQFMRKFWEGFEYQSRRLKDDKGNGMLLKLKDWPPGDDFAEILPSRYNDLMNGLPLGEYTQRTGRLNLASRLPECFVRPDLGPKMYNAYGSAAFPNKGTTNLHLDISDAVNVMVYVGIPKDSDNEEHIKEAYRAIDEAGCDILTRRRAREKGEVPGALWHIYHARDADKIRDLLNKVAIENGVRLEPYHDPIHDQSWYLDGPLRERLHSEYMVEGFPIVQCQGDAVFIPAGAPHQVRNLHNCIKVAEDFVSPENISHCFHLTQEFRNLSDTHMNHEDKLQIKNIMYHAVKDSLSVLCMALAKSKEVEEEPETKVEPES